MTARLFMNGVFAFVRYRSDCMEHPDEGGERRKDRAERPEARAQDREEGAVHPDEHREHPYAFAQTLCTTEAGGCGQAETLSAFAPMPEALAQTRCVNSADGCAQAETPFRKSRESLATQGESCTTSRHLQAREERWNRKTGRREDLRGVQRQ